MYRNLKPNPYPLGNYVQSLDYLEALIRVMSKEEGQKCIAESEGGYQDVFLELDHVQLLSPPVKAVAAMIVFERVVSDDEVDADDRAVLARVKENGAVPTKGSGFGMYHQDAYEIIGFENIQNFRVVALAEGVVLRVQFYGSNQIT